MAHILRLWGAEMKYNIQNWLLMWPRGIHTASSGHWWILISLIIGMKLISNWCLTSFSIYTHLRLDLTNLLQVKQRLTELSSVCSPSTYRHALIHIHRLRVPVCGVVTSTGSKVFAPSKSSHVTPMTHREPFPSQEGPPAHFNDRANGG